ncbi:DUF5702 domain-containing protein [Ruminiclostridium cellulolyticum]|uniref:Uncharacterized protein n=1 Tax=Ruminiclostridium cellulolyticum (strain ATCC 35319 / DSM 5812 / JCM 6584 / H10) TaxID=394503 RepID=B8I6J8_RUMCH|nr:DUF5702 domain-containing protein [Ruminiclostridium cellulolyticum]ACL74890.1 hypothetical protein Ccel_0508 [Ruminiclostridium cellulolyticum H10]
MEQHKTKGAITVFLSIVLTAIFLVIGTFTDGARLRLAQSHVQRANKAAISSVLANYNNELKDEYGLFGVYLDEDSLQETYEEYLSKNLGIVGKGKSMYDFSIDNIKLENPYSLENKEVIENQIMEFMKYRAPYKLATELIEKVKGIKNISKGSNVYSRKMQTDKQAAEIGRIQLSLENKTKRINEFNLTTQLSALKDDFKKQNEVLNEKNKSIQNLENIYQNETNIKKKQDVGKLLQNVREEMQNINNTKNNIKNSILDGINEFKSLNSEAISEAAAIADKKKLLCDRINGEMEQIEEHYEGIHELQNSYKKSMGKIKNMVEQDNSESVMGGFKQNIENCNQIISSSESDEENFLNSLDKLSNIAVVNYSFIKTESAHSNDKDNRKKASDELKTAFKKDGDSKKIPDDILKNLPSKKSGFKEETGARTWDNPNFEDESFAVDNFNYIAEKDNTFGDIANKISEELFLNEYIMGTFKHGIPILEGQTEKDAYNLRSKDKSQRISFFTNFEIEYIINGNRDETINSMLTKSEIMAIRLISNVLHIYADSSKITRVTSLAAALSSWCAGLSTPLIQTMLVFSWAAFESLYDINILEKGGKVALFKTDVQWMTDISGAVSKKEKNKVSNDILCLSYQDYLKIFLVTMDKDKKLMRVQDLVQLNKSVKSPGFLLADCKVFFKAYTGVSIKNLFVAFPMFTTESRRKVSRSNINESMYLGY